MGGKQRFFYVGRDTVTEEIKVTSVAVSTTPHKTDYIEGDKLDTTGLSLTVTYSDGSTQTVTSGFTCDKTTLSAGDSTVTVTFEGFTAQFQVTIQSANPIVAAGNYGALYWELTQDGTLTLTGSGDMPDAVSDTDVPWRPDCDDIRTVLVGDGITSIGDYAFYGCSKIQRVSLPDSITRIGSDAFLGCLNMTEFNIPRNLTAIGSHAFLDCYGLTQFDIPEGVTVIEERAFEYCIGLTQVSIPDSVTTIRSNAFRNCSGLTQIRIPDSVTTLEMFAFYGCSGLTEVTVPAGITNIDVSTFHKCDSLKKITVLNKACTVYNAETTLGVAGTTTVCGYAGSPAETYALKYGYTFEAIDGEGGDVGEDPPLERSGTYGENITWELREDGTLVLSGTGNMPIIDVIDDKAQTPWDQYIDVIHTVEIGQGITNIAGYLFSGCPKITQVSIPDSVTDIVNFAFYGCTGLKQISIPNSVTHIRAAAFGGCTGLTQITIPDSVTHIGMEAFCGCTGLTQINIPAGVTTIEPGVFRDCSGLTQISIPEGVTSIGYDAFMCCYNLTQITIPGSVTSIGESAFSACTGLTQITVLNKDCAISEESLGQDTLGMPGTTVVRGYKGSTAETFAKTYGYTFQSLD